MTNPVSQSPSAQLPVAGSQLIDPQTGMATSLFQRFLAGLFLRTGGAAGVDAGDVGQTASNALSLATQANQSAALAQDAASTAQNTADGADVTATAALNGATSAVQLANAMLKLCLQAANNLADLTSRRVARVNLGVSLVPITVAFDAPSSGLDRYIPIVVPAQVPGNLAGTVVYAGVKPSADALFTLSYIRNAVTTVIGTITIINHSTTVILSPCNPVNLVFGDVLVVQCPSPKDATLADVGITIPMTIS